MRKDNEAVVFILLGQSNAVGHELPMEEQDKIKNPLGNVFGLKRTLNQSYDNTELVWDHYISSEMNLAEEQDDTYSIVNCLAYRWQQAIDSGILLPDLYIVQIAIGAQGVTSNYMWHPDREPKLIPGKLEDVDISLHSFTKHILSLVNKHMEGANKRVHYLMHWRGGEEDMCVAKNQLDNDLQDIYERIFKDYAEALKTDIDIVLHRIICDTRAMYLDPSGEHLNSLKYINQVFEDLSEKHEHISVFDPRNHPDYLYEKEHCGVFLDDDVHFTREVNDWIASGIITDMREFFC